MRLPQISSNYVRPVHTGWYVTAKLRQANREAQADEVEAITNRILTFGRKMDDTQQPVQIAMARRDSAEEKLQESTRTFRLKLAARELGADRKPPYTNIFPKGISHYTDAHLDNIPVRYRELQTRVEASLPENDSLRQYIVDAIDSGTQVYSDSNDEVNAARTAAAIAKTDFENIRIEWDRQMTKVYGMLVAELGKKEANRFFPRPASKSKSSSAAKSEKASSPAKSETPAPAETAKAASAK